MYYKYWNVDGNRIALCNASTYTAQLDTFLKECSRPCRAAPTRAQLSTAPLRTSPNTQNSQLHQVVHADTCTTRLAEEAGPAIYLQGSKSGLQQLQTRAVRRRSSLHAASTVAADRALSCYFLDGAAAHLISSDSPLAPPVSTAYRYCT
jgi:hypothetical protein